MIIKLTEIVKTLVMVLIIVTEFLSIIQSIIVSSLKMIAKTRTQTRWWLWSAISRRNCWKQVTILLFFSIFFIIYSRQLTRSVHWLECCVKLRADHCCIVRSVLAWVRPRRSWSGQRADLVRHVRITDEAEGKLSQLSLSLSLSFWVTLNQFWRERGNERLTSNKLYLYILYAFIYSQMRLFFLLRIAALSFYYRAPFSSFWSQKQSCKFGYIFKFLRSNGIFLTCKLNMFSL